MKSIFVLAALAASAFAGRYSFSSPHAGSVFKVEEFFEVEIVEVVSIASLYVAGFPY